MHFAAVGGVRVGLEIHLNPSVFWSCGKGRQKNWHIKHKSSRYKHTQEILKVHITRYSKLIKLFKFLIINLYGFSLFLLFSINWLLCEYENWLDIVTEGFYTQLQHKNNKTGHISFIFYCFLNFFCISLFLSSICFLCFFKLEVVFLSHLHNITIIKTKITSSNVILEPKMFFKYLQTIFHRLCTQIMATFNSEKTFDYIILYNSWMVSPIFVKVVSKDVQGLKLCNHGWFECRTGPTWG